MLRVRARSVKLMPEIRELPPSPNINSGVQLSLYFQCPILKQSLPNLLVRRHNGEARHGTADASRSWQAQITWANVASSNSHLRDPNKPVRTQSMPWSEWLFWRTSKPGDDTNQEAVAPTGQPSLQSADSWEKRLNRVDWSHYTTPQAISLSLVTTATTLLLVHVYKTYLRRIPTVDYLKPSLFRRRSLYGYVTSVGDGDNFHLFHTPGGRLLGWNILPGRKIAASVKTNNKSAGKKVKGNTVHVRIAGVDAPEMAHFGRPEQPYGREALEWLRGYVSHRFVRVYPYRRDQYDRVVCSVFRRKWGFLKTDVGLEMIKRGFATVYEAKFGSEFGEKEAEYRAAEANAKARKVGMWQEPGFVGRMLGRKQSTESPREYKTRMTKADKAADMAK